MSLDFYLTKVEPVAVYSRNITHNLTAMWSKAGIYDDLYNSEGKVAKDILENLERGCAKMKATPEQYKALNPDNGWGDYDGALEFLEEVIEACKANPESKIEISK